MPFTRILVTYGPHCCVMMTTMKLAIVPLDANFAFCIFRFFISPFFHFPASAVLRFFIPHPCVPRLFSEQAAIGHLIFVALTYLTDRWDDRRPVMITLRHASTHISVHLLIANKVIDDVYRSSVLRKDMRLLLGGMQMSHGFLFRQISSPAALPWLQKTMMHNLLSFHVVSIMG